MTDAAAPPAVELRCVDGERRINRAPIDRAVHVHTAQHLNVGSSDVKCRHSGHYFQI